MGIDRLLAVVGLVLGLPGFFALFFSPYTTAAIITAAMAMLALAGAFIAQRILARPPFRLNGVQVELAFNGSRDEATLTKKYRLVANNNGLQHLTHRNIAADGSVDDIRWNGQPVSPSQIKKVMGEYEVTIPLHPAPIRNQEFQGALSYRLKDSFPASSEALIYCVDFPAKCADVAIKLPCNCHTVAARLVVGGSESDLTSKLKHNGHQIDLGVDSPRVGSKIEIYWNW